MRIRIIKSNRDHTVGDIIEVSPNVAFGLIDQGIAQLSKEMVPDDYKQAGVNNGKPTKLRTNRSSKR